MSTRYHFQTYSRTGMAGHFKISEMEQLPYGETGAVRINDWRVLQME